MLVRALRDILAQYRNPHLQRSRFFPEKIDLSKSHYGAKLWASQNIFAGHYLFGFPQIWPYPWQNPM
jgi:hypothetical protein